MFLYKNTGNGEAIAGLTNACASTSPPDPTEEVEELPFSRVTERQKAALNDRFSESDSESDPESDSSRMELIDLGGLGETGNPGGANRTELGTATVSNFNCAGRRLPPPAPALGTVRALDPRRAGASLITPNPLEVSLSVEGERGSKEGEERR
jgi:hypothetical protein